MKKKNMLILVLIPSLLLALFGSTTLSSPTTRIYVNPPTIAATLAENFTVDINVEDVTGLYAYLINLTWDPQILDALDFTEGSFLKTGGYTDFPGAHINQSEGWLHVWSRLMGESPFPGVNGSGMLANVTFHGANLGGCDVNFFSIILVGSPVLVPTPPYLGDANGDMIVDNFDAVTLARAFGSVPGDPDWNPDADFNNDSIVDFFDMFYIDFNLRADYTMTDQALEPVLITHEVNGGYATIYPGAIKEDLNGDDTVNMVDIATVGEAYGSRPGDARWNPLCDLMRDNVIDDFDSNIVARMFGWGAGDPIILKPVEWKLNITIDHLVRGVESHTVTILSDYIVYSNYTFDHLNAELIFDVTSSIDAFCNITIPRGLLNGAFRVELDDVAAPSILTWNGTHTCIYFTSDQLSHRVKIVGLTPGDVTAVPGETQPIVDIFDVVFVSTHFEDPLRYIDLYLGPHFY